MPVVFEFGRWTGEGSISVNVKYKFSAFDKLSMMIMLIPVKKVI